MIEELEIRDLGVIAHSLLPLGPGFTAITGETGAGKTMVVGALGLIMGARSDAGAVRRGADRARITGVMRTADPEVRELVHDVGGDIEDDALILTRTVSAEGRSRATVGGTQAPATTLANIAPHLFAVHGQSDQLRLRSTAAQRHMLDRYGGGELERARDAYSSVFTEHQRVRERLSNLVTDQRERILEAEQLRLHVEEIRNVNPLPGEDEELRVRIERLGNIESLREAATVARVTLTGTGEDPFERDAIALLAHALSALDAATGDPEIQPIHEVLTSVQVQLTEAASDLAAFTNGLDEEGPEELARTSARLELITGLTRKYGDTTDEVLAYADRAEVRLEELGSDDVNIEQLTLKVETLEAEQVELAATLTELRTAAAVELGERVSQELTQLALPDAKLIVQVTPQAAAPHGADHVELLLAPHKGSAPRPLHRGASGGELSRIMLALEVTVAQVDPVPTFVFDEIDTGVGGQAAIEIGRRLRKLAETSQVIVVTHLAQVAAFAHEHLNIRKDSSGDFTESSCRPVTGDERLQEMARLLSGMTDSQSALEHAAELLELGAR